MVLKVYFSRFLKITFFGNFSDFFSDFKSCWQELFVCQQLLCNSNQRKIRWKIYINKRVKAGVTPHSSYVTDPSQCLYRIQLGSSCMLLSELGMRAGPLTNYTPLLKGNWPDCPNRQWDSVCLNVCFISSCLEWGNSFWCLWCLMECLE